MDNNGSTFEKEYFDNLDSFAEMLRLFEYLPDVHFFVKNQTGHMMAANTHFAQRLGFENAEELIGKSTGQTSPPELVKGYLEDDQYVMTTGKDMINKVELNQAGDGSVNWFVTTKIPLYRKDGSIAGIAGIARDIKKAAVALGPYEQFTVIFDYIADQYSESISIPGLAKMVNMSQSQFERQFKKLFGVSPRRYIIQYRINKACHELSHTKKTIAQIAMETGFYDQSSMTKHFSNYKRTTPRDYRTQTT